MRRSEAQKVPRRASSKVGQIENGERRRARSGRAAVACSSSRGGCPRGDTQLVAPARAETSASNARDAVAGQSGRRDERVHRTDRSRHGRNHRRGGGGGPDARGAGTRGAGTPERAGSREGRRIRGPRALVAAAPRAQAARRRELVRQRRDPERTRTPGFATAFRGRRRLGCSL